MTEHSRNVDALGIRVLQCPDSRLHGGRWVLPARFGLGRGPASGVDLVVQDTKMSRRHAIFVRQSPNSYRLEDQQSRNGTFVNGARIIDTVLETGSIVRLGDTLLAFGPTSTGVRNADDPLVGDGALISRVRLDVQRVAASNLPVLLLGETGTGKDVVAQRLHALSGRKGPFVPVNCGAIPVSLMESALFGHKKGAFTGAGSDAVGYFEAAAGGTLFLDEVGEIELAQQPALLRVLEDGTFSPVGATARRTCDVRVVAATNRDLQAQVAAESFRADLYARLAGFVIPLPPLRARRDDIPDLARHFLRLFQPERSLSWTAGFLEGLLLHPWPLNVRELRVVMERLSLLANETTPFTSRDLRHVLDADQEATARTAEPSALPNSASGPQSQILTSERPTQADLEAQLIRAQGNVTRLAEHYGKNPKQIYRWMQRYGLTPEKFR